MVESMKPDGKERATPGGKRPYSAPRVVHSEQVETLAGTCDTSGGGKGTGDPTCNLLRS